MVGHDTHQCDQWMERQLAVSFRGLRGQSQLSSCSYIWMRSGWPRNPTSHLSIYSSLNGFLYFNDLHTLKLAANLIIPVFPSPRWRRGVTWWCSSGRRRCYGQWCILRRRRLASEWCRWVRVSVRPWCFLFLLSTAVVSPAVHWWCRATAARITALNTYHNSHSNKTGLLTSRVPTLLPQILIMWVGIAEKVLKVRGQRSRSWPDQLSEWVVS